MAYVRKKTNPSGRVIWQSRWAEPGPGGKRRQRTKNHERQAEARAHAAKMEAE